MKECPRVISLDVETYGACEYDHAGVPLPPQRHFHPQRCLLQDRVPLSSLILTCGITFPVEDPRCDVSDADEDPTFPSATSAPLIPPKETSSCPTSSTAAPVEVQDSPNGSRTVSATTAAAGGPSPSGTGWNLKRLMRLRPGPTMLLHLNNPHHLQILLRCIQWVDTILGVNLPFDLMMLRAFRPDLYQQLDGRHTIIDFIYCRYLVTELTNARGLKDYGALHGLYSYTADQLRLQEGRRFKNPYDPEFQAYQCSDPHNSITAIAHAATTIFFEYGKPCSPQPPSSSSSSSGGSLATSGTSKLSPECIDHYSSLWWSCVRMAEAGIPLDLEDLTALEKSLLDKAAKARDYCGAHGLPLSGKGSEVPRIQFIESALSACDTPEARRYVFNNPDTSLLASDLIERTEKENRISAGVTNRATIRVILKKIAPHTPFTPGAPTPPTNKKGELGMSLFGDPPAPTPAPYLELLDKWDEATKAEKLVSTYTYPLLRHHRSDPSNQETRFIPLTPTPYCPDLPSYRNPAYWWEPHVGLGFPTIYAVPSNVKDTQGSSGGQKQSRLSFKNPAATTWNIAIKKCIRSRWRGGSVYIFDLEQIELKVAGLLSGEPSILEVYQRNGDLHAERCIDLFGKEYLYKKFAAFRTVTDPKKWKSLDQSFADNERQWAKKFNFEDLYLAGPDKMQRIFIEETGLFMPISFFHEVVESRRRLRPALLAWQQRVLAICKLQGYYELPFFGQSRYFIGGVDSNPIGEMVNFPIQATAANVMHCIMRRIHESLPRLSHPLPRIHPFLNVYDAGFIDSHPAESKHIPEIVAAAVDHVRTRGYWRKLQDHYNAECPLSYDIKEVA